MTINNFVRTVWSARLTELVQRQSVYSMVSNMDWEADAANARVVKIQEVATPEVGDYTKNTPISYGELSDSSLDLVLDQQKYFAFTVEDVDKAQTVAPLMQSAVEQSSRKLSIVQDNYLRDIFANVTSANTVTSATTANATTADTLKKDFADVIEKIQCDDHVVAPGDIEAVIPPAAQQRMNRLLTGEGFGVADESLRSGFNNRFMGVDTHVTTAVTQTDSAANWLIPVVVRKRPVTLANQVMEMEAMRLEDLFADGVRGLWVYGAKNVRPEYLYALKLKV